MSPNYLPPDHWLRSLKEVELLTDIACEAMRLSEKDWEPHIECALVHLFDAVKKWKESMR